MEANVFNFDELLQDIAMGNMKSNEESEAEAKYSIASSYTT
jgi:hypothetical protein